MSRANAVGWRNVLGALWGQLAVADVFGCQERSLVASRAKRLLALVEYDLLGVWTAAEANRRAVLRCAALPLECCARVWQAFGPAAGERRPHLFHRLEDAIAKRERQIGAAELPLGVNRASVSRAVCSARIAVEDLLDSQADRAEALAALEDATVELASLAIRIAMSLGQTSGASSGSVERRIALRRQLDAVACEVSTGTPARQTGKDEDNDGAGGHIGVGLRAALSVAPMAEAIALASLDDGDPSLRADAFCSLRARWLELAVGLWMTVRGLDHLLVVETFDDEDRLKATVSARAYSALARSGICDRPGSFDHREAWERHRSALCELVSEVCRALQTRDQDAVLRSQQLAVRRLAQALAAIWTIDQPARRAAPGASRPCR